MKIVILFILQLFTIAGIAQYDSHSWVQESSSITSLTENIGQFDTIQNNEIEFFSKSGNIHYFFSKKSLFIGCQAELNDAELHEISEGWKGAELNGIECIAGNIAISAFKKGNFRPIKLKALNFIKVLAFSFFLNVELKSFIKFFN